MTSINDTPRTDDPHRTDDRTGLIHLEDGVLLYDVENPAAWIQSDETVALGRQQ